MSIINPVIKRSGFAEGNYFIGDAFTGGKFSFEEFNATSRLIDTLKAGLKKLDVVKITAIERTLPHTRAGHSSVRELTISLPIELAIGKYELKGTDGTSLSFKDTNGHVVEATSGTLEILPSEEDVVKCKIKAYLDVPGSEGETFALNARFQVLKAG
ncbi:hypothetical protein PMI36_01546 [Pseudomonas sp. GM79]|uniref:hypothetical protein n=1 Tax=Pseudomonas sp. GM79 TaxID=1144338 RepID=UPI00026F72D8|nr:hypothetical protein [Pseudomonas sp. GM79]EJN25927.1 hypothetical protein PMI36_01546 [Pseudomonas sp. GM79]